MKETTWIIDTASGALTVEGMSESELARVAGDLLTAPSHINCARPVNVPPARMVHVRIGSDEPHLRVHRIYHGSVVEGPGRRSVLQLMGCTLRCPGFIYSLEWVKYDATHDRHQRRTTYI